MRGSRLPLAHTCQSPPCLRQLSGSGKQHGPQLPSQSWKITARELVTLRTPTESLKSDVSKSEFPRKDADDLGWRGPALLLKLQDNGPVFAEYQGRPHLVPHATRTTMVQWTIAGSRSWTRGWHRTASCRALKLARHFANTFSHLL